MKIILSESELAATIRKHYPVPANYTVEDVTVSKYGRDFCTIELEPLPEPAPAPVAPDTTVGASGYTVAEEAAAAGVRG